MTQKTYMALYKAIPSIRSAQKDYANQDWAYSHITKKEKYNTLQYYALNDKLKLIGGMEWK